MACALLMLAGLLCSTTSASAQESSLASLEPLPLPHRGDDVSKVVDWRHTDNRWLFVAYEHEVYVRSPWGWDKVWELVDDYNSIRALGSINLDGSEHLLIGTDNGVWEVLWARRTSLPDRSWTTMSPYDFRSRKLLGASHPRVSSIVYPGGTGVAKAYVLANGGKSHPVIVRDGHLALGAPLFNGELFQSLEWHSGLAGVSYAWPYSDDLLYELDENGHLTDVPVDFGELANNSGGVAIETIAIDPIRHFLYVFTRLSGTFLAQLDPQSGRRISDFFRVRYLDGLKVVFADVVLGRLLVVEEGGRHRPVHWQQTLGFDFGRLQDIAATMVFEPAQSDSFPEGIVPSNVARPAEDVLWVKDSAQDFWEWTPNSWTKLQPQNRPVWRDLLLQDIRPGRPAPLIVPDWLREQLFFNAAQEPIVQTHVGVGANSALHSLVDDPEGRGVWAIEAPFSGMGSLGYIRFATGHGMIDTADRLSGGHSIDVARLAHETKSGQKYWPWSREGGVLLPMGSEFLYGVSGEWTLVELPFSSDTSLRDLTPGAKSSSSAWLGLRRTSDGRSQLVRIDIGPNLQQLQFDSVGDPFPTHVNVCLVADDTGNVWLAHSVDGGWILARIRPNTEQPAERLVAPTLPEPPRWVIREFFPPEQPDSVFIISDTGYVDLSAGTAAKWVQLIPQDGWPKTRFTRLYPHPTHPLIGTQSFYVSGPGRLYATMHHLRINGRSMAIEPWRSEIGPLAKRIPKSSGWPAMDIHRSTPPVLVPFDDTLGGPIEGGHLGVQVELRGLESVQDAILAGVDSGGGKRLAVIHGSQVVFVQPARGLSWFGERRAVPIGLRALGEDGDVGVWDLRDNWPPEQLSGDVTRLELRTRPDYADWWIRSPAATAGRANGDAPWIDADDGGVIPFQVAQGNDYYLEIQRADLAGLRELGTQALVLTIDAIPVVVPTGYRYILGVLGGIIVVGMAVSLSLELRMWMLAAAGRRWSLRNGDCDIRVEIRGSGPQSLPRLTARTDRAAVEVASLELGPAVKSWRDGAREWASSSGLRDADRVRVEVEPHLFLKPWSQWLGSNWSEGASAVIAGQVVSSTAGKVRLPPPFRRICFGPVSYAGDRERGRAMGLVDREIEIVSSAFCSHVAEVQARESTPGGLTRLLASSDIVHVACHATLEAIVLCGGQFDHVALRKATSAGQLRCKLIVLSACEIAGQEDATTSLVSEFVNGGTNVLAANRDVDSAVCNAFFSELYDYFIPRTTRSGPSIADAIRHAVGRCEKRFSEWEDADWRRGIDSFVLFGDPSLHYGRVVKTGEN